MAVMSISSRGPMRSVLPLQESSISNPLFAFPWRRLTARAENMADYPEKARGMLHHSGTVLRIASAAAKTGFYMYHPWPDFLPVYRNPVQKRIVRRTNLHLGGFQPADGCDVRLSLTCSARTRICGMWTISGKTWRTLRRCLLSPGGG